MKRSFKTFLLWFLILVLPLHAAAAQVGMTCALARQSSSVAQAHEHPAARDSLPAQSHEHHQHGGSMDRHDMASSAHHEHASSDAPGDAKHFSCSACSAFCIGAIAPPSPSIALPVYEGSEQPVSFLAEPGPGFIPEGLQRPPRLT
jgi:hypothetical protein